MRIIRTVALFLVCGVSAALLGHYVAKGVAARSNDQKVREMAQARQAENAGLLEEMGTIKVGEALDDFAFLDLDGNSVNLTDLVRQRSLIMLFSPGCGGCDTEIENIRNVVSDSEDGGHFILIGAGSPEEVRDYLAKHTVNCPVFCDAERDYAHGLKLPGYPFNMVVDGDMMLQDVILGSMHEFEIEEFLRSM